MMAGLTRDPDFFRDAIASRFGTADGTDCGRGSGAWTGEGAVATLGSGAFCLDSK